MPKCQNHFKCNTRSHHNFCKNLAGLLSFFGHLGSLTVPCVEETSPQERARSWLEKVSKWFAFYESPIFRLILWICKHAYVCHVCIYLLVYTRLYIQMNVQTGGKRQKSTFDDECTTKHRSRNNIIRVPCR